ncbi:MULTISPECIES: hypothetical protein [Pseudoalteromonas]|uniref:Lipoprotein n=1 Tax=Pseudoalteromonas luteoviolacea (strain 2ta16) TaxID=1353533 RepID=V4HKY9_PSEL2|nr:MULTISPECIES: hypothetical protein [Pseudoalteromonas]ESP91485.1 hypothetical protein PL2TA16_00284 [Pseudoalteromonas luteoviolacea 2ta16]KZN40134.1 hypothetical protein N483_18265 [Pseudoalteromonas luteoviolacea NCIMB 1944]MCG7551177.1 hypothetical protein [Pseudoalteromonas sp. Of7M-16]
MKYLLIPAATLLMGGCASTYSPVPENYSGAISKFESTQKRHSEGKADLFYLEKVDGKRIHNSAAATRSATYGQGFALTTEHVVTDTPSSMATFTIKGRTLYAAPIQAMTGTVYEVTGDVTFSPEPDITYIVRGELGKAYSAVWIEEKGSGKVILKKIEIKGDSELGFFEK